MPRPVRDAIARVLSVDDAWFDFDAAGHPGMDIVHAFQIPKPILGATNHEFHTLTIDLSKPESVLLEAMAKDTRYEIRRAERDGLQVRFERQLNPEIIERFRIDYDQLAERKGLHRLDMRWFARQQRHALELSCSIDQADRTLTWHAYVCSKTRARLLFSVSNGLSADSGAARQMIGRANRYHHWADIRHFKAAGKNTYDLGGVYVGEKDQQQIQIAQFKRGFGGADETSYNSTLGLTAKGRVAVWVAQRVGRAP
jgi:hypothetical protein